MTGSFLYDRGEPNRAAAVGKSHELTRKQEQNLSATGKPIHPSSPSPGAYDVDPPPTSQRLCSPSSAPAFLDKR